MKSIKVITTLNICISLFSYLVFVFNQLCNLRFWGLWDAWNLSGYAYALLIGPLTAVVSVVFSINSIRLLRVDKNIKKYIVINISFAAIDILLVASGYVFSGVFTWA